MTTPRIGTAENNVAFEGQRAFVTLVRAPVDVTAADVTLPAELSARDVRCAGMACAIVAEVIDTTPSRGMAIPPPIDALVRQIILETSTDRVSATVNVMPLDRIESAGGEAVVNGTYFASSLDATGDATFRGALGGDPVRWLVFGDVVLDGSVDVSAMGNAAGPGGVDGAEAGLTATGEGGDADCAGDFFAEACGGSGGDGDASAAGGGGAGAFALIALGDLQLTGTITARGGDGATGGGGGRVLVSGLGLVGDPSVELAGGEGATAGGEGEARTCARTSLDEQLESARYIFDTPTLEIDGTLVGATMIRAETADGVPLGTAAVDSAGAFHLVLTLPEGFSRVRLFETGTDGIERRSFLGNHVELERRSSRTLPQPVGGLLDVVYLPAS